MTISQLRYFLAVAEMRHFGRAAEACHVSQPTLSTQLRKLEDYLGTVLFERTSKSVDITGDGLRLLPHARRAVAEVDQMRSQARRHRAPLCGPLRLGIIPTLCPYLLPWVLPALSARHPQLELSIVEDLTEHLLAALTDHRLDAACLALPLPGGGFRTRALFEEAFLVALPTGHPLARGRRVAATVLDEENVLFLREGHCLRDQALSICRNADTGTAAFSGTSLETLLRLVVHGHGVTLVPMLAAADHEKSNQDIAFVRLAPSATRTVGLAWRPTYPRPDELDALGRSLVDALPREHVEALRTA